MKTHKMQSISQSGQQDVMRRKRQLCQFYRQARKRQFSRLQSDVQQRLEWAEKLQRLVQEGRPDE